MTAGMRMRQALSGAGLNRSMIVRRLVRLGHPRLRELHARALSDRDPAALALSAFFRWLERGKLFIPQGHAGGLLFEMRYLPLSHAHLGSIAFGNLETAVQEAMVRHLGPGSVFYDIGANLGFFSLLAAHLVGLDKGRVYAFEAAPDNARAIQANAELNGIPNITVIDKAVSSRSGMGRLQIVDDQSWSKLEEYGEHPHTERLIDVELVAIDDLLRAGELAPPTAVKIDVEGAEIAVLEGMRETLERHQPAVICELHDTHREFLQAMSSVGYRLINLEGPQPIDEAGASAHALALPALDPGE
jgi:FkbM family methyltransferase